MRKKLLIFWMTALFVLMAVPCLAHEIPADYSLLTKTSGGYQYYLNSVKQSVSKTGSDPEPSSFAADVWIREEFPKEVAQRYIEEGKKNNIDVTGLSYIVKNVIITLDLQKYYEKDSYYYNDNGKLLWAYHEAKPEWVQLQPGMYGYEVYSKTVGNVMYNNWLKNIKTTD